ncbi:Ig-like domain-containing protein [candidate division KSB1 bacterium]|nr:Ig-like domain-containing protein [candidate division KSB1 bacterium]
MRKILFWALLWWLTPLQAQTDLTGLKFCLDPGHGDYPHDKPFETRINLQVAQFLKAYLEQSGATVILTRTDSAMNVTLSQREALANRNNVDFFHSIHHNAFQGNANYSLLLFEEKSNGQPEWPGQSDVMGQQMVNYLYQYLYTTGKYNRGDLSFLGYNLGVLNDLIMPGVLSEASFWDFIPEVHRLNARLYLKLEAFACLQAFLDYYHARRQPNAFLVGVVQDLQGQLLDSVQVRLTNGVEQMDYVTDSQNIGITPQDNQWSGFPLIPKVTNGMFFFENFKPGPAQLILSGANVLTDTVAVVVPDTTARKVGPIALATRIPPRLTVVYPTAKDLRKSKVTSPIVIEFSKPMDPASLIAAFSIQPKIDSLIFQFYQNNAQFRINAVPKWHYWTEYQVTISGTQARDRWGFLLDGDNDGLPGGDYHLNFRTQSSDQQAPQLLSTYPAADSKQLAVETIIAVEFNEWLDPVTINATAVKLMQNANEVPITISYQGLAEKGLIFLTPATVLMAGQEYAVNIAATVTDIFGNALARSYRWAFTTRSTVFQYRTLADFETGITAWSAPDSAAQTYGIIPESTRISVSTAVTFPLTASTGALQLDYAWESTVATPQLTIPWKSELAPQFTPDGTLQLFLGGDASGAGFRFVLNRTDSLQTLWSEWQPVDWVGWRLVEWDLAAAFKNARPGLSPLTLQVAALQLTGQKDRLRPQGTLFFDDLRLALPVAVGGMRMDPPEITTSCILYQNFPNPFNARTVITYRLATSEPRVQLIIFNTLGQAVRRFQDLAPTPGIHQLIWDGCDQSGATVASGWYYYQLQAAQATPTRQLLFSK